MEPSLKKKLIVSCLILIVIIGFGWRFLLIYKNDGLIFDEGYDFIQAQNSVRTLITGQYSDVRFHPPLHYLFLHFWTKIRVDELFFRFPFVVFGTLGVFLMFFAAKELFQSKKLGLLAALLFANSAFSIFYSGQVRITQFLLAVEILALFFFLRAVRTNQWRNWVLFGLVMGTAFYIDYSAIWFLLVMNLYFIYLYLSKQTKKDGAKKWLSSNILIFFIFLPWLPIFLKHLPSALNNVEKPNFRSLIDLLKIFSIGKSFIFLRSGKRFINVGFFDDFLVLLPLFWAFLYCCWKIFFKRASKNQRSVLVLMSLFFLPLLISFVLSQKFPIFQDRNLSAFIIGMCLMLAGIVNFSKGKFLKLVAAVSGGIFLLLNLNSINYFYRNVMGDSWKEPAIYLMANLKEGDVMLAREGANDWPMKYYLDYRYKYPLKRKNIFVYSFGSPKAREKLFKSVRGGKYWLFGLSSDIERDIKNFGAEGDFFRRFISEAKKFNLEEKNFRLIDEKDIRDVIIYEVEYFD